MKHLAIICIGFIFSLASVSIIHAQIDRQAVVGAWLFDEGTGEIARDLSGKSGSGKLIKGPKWVNGYTGKAIDFDGQDDYVEIALPDVFGDIPTNDFTIAFWISVQNIAGSGTVWTRIVEALHDSGNYLQFNIQINDGELGLNVIDTGEERTFMVDSPISADTWYHVAGTWEASTDTVGLYLDGVLQSVPGVVPASPGTERTLDIGRRSDGNVDTYFDGIIDEFAVFDIALTEEEIEFLMTEGLQAVAAVSSRDKLAATWGKIRNF